MNSQSQPLVSVITPAFNSENCIRQTISSVQQQTFSKWEMFVVDDCSQDKTASIVEDLASSDTRIKLVKLRKNQGPAVARNEALKIVDTRFVAFLDSDDLWMPKKLDLQIQFMTESKVVFSYTQYRRISLDGNSVGRLIHIPRMLNYQQLLKNTAIATSTVIIDQEKTGPLKTMNLGYDDFILWLSILKRGFAAYGLEEDLLRYRVGSSTSISSKKIRSVQWVWTIYRDVENLNLLFSCWCFLNYALNALWKRRSF